MRDEYIEFVIASFIRTKEFNSLVGAEWHSEELMDEIQDSVVLHAFQASGFDVTPEDFKIDIEELFSALIDAGAIVWDGDDHAGNWFKFVFDKKNVVIDQIISKNSAAARVNRLGPKALERALHSIISSGPSSESSTDAGLDSSAVSVGAVPASDRIVQLTHNQIQDFDLQVTDIVHELEQNDNGDPENPGLRERLLGQLKAGRELIRAGEIRAYLLYEVLVRALAEILEKYGNETVKSLANALLGAIVSQILEG